MESWFCERDVQTEPPEVFFKKRCSQKFRKIHWKTLVPESLFLKSCRTQPATLLKKRPQHRCFPVTFMKFLGTPFYRIPLVAASGCRNVEELKSKLRSCVQKGCAKFCGSRAIAGPLGLVPLCHRAIVPSSFFSLVFCGSKSFPRGYDVGSKFFSWVFRGSKTSFCGYELGPKFFLLGISWVQYFWSWLIS